MSSNTLRYFDHSATTPTHPDVLAAMLPYFTERFGNPSSHYGIAGDSRAAVRKARAQVAAAIGASPEEIFFTAGGTESDNWAIKGVALAHPEGRGHIITTAIEHHAVLHTVDWLENLGYTVTRLPVDCYGRVDPGDVEEAIKDDTILISVMTANNEVGTIQPIRRIGEIARRVGVAFHTDAVQAIGNIPIDVEQDRIDLLSLSAHKFYGPKGVGALYIRQGTVVDTLIHGGAQESGRRAGTENLPGIVGLGAAIERACRDIPAHNARILAMRDRLLRGILEQIPNVHLNGHSEERLAGNLNLSFDGVDGEALLTMLGMRGVCASTGSACSSGSESPSHVLTALGVPPSRARSSLRLSLGDLNDEEDIDTLLALLPDAVARLRRLSGTGA
ncbi:cysteine desulfurase NifS [Methanofollis fontis]|uniref:Cysteine desulfurase n=1 Tax=Methanofollis fontis TaxID=2052832 RepID=A0A483CUA4_9EURY|nr:cysteine desulfurase NifS [Methanofollis fontis]TAJ44467.1 cysteine desulfurase NifS [Methanofollis fontis]